MLDMELIHADNLTPDQLMVEDLIKFGDKDVAEFRYTDSIPLYVFIEEEE